jgi:AcrR family transcriptional regulator
MVRTTKAPDERRRELITTAQQLFYKNGYEHTSVSDIVKEVGVAQGTFYYYFDSKHAVLEAVIEDLMAQSIALMQAIIADQTLDAIAKWNKTIQVIGNWKIGRKADMMAISRILQMDGNLRLRCQLQSKGIQLIAPELAQIVAQGNKEGVFHTEYAVEAAQCTIAIWYGSSDALTDIVLNPEEYKDPITLMQRKFEAAQTAIERVLGAPPGSLPIADKDMVVAWFASSQ